MVEMVAGPNWEMMAVISGEVREWVISSAVRWHLIWGISQSSEIYVSGEKWG